jgi:hypothetical protein
VSTPTNAGANTTVTFTIVDDLDDPATSRVDLFASVGAGVGGFVDGGTIFGPEECAGDAAPEGAGSDDPIVHIIFSADCVDDIDQTGTSGDNPTAREGSVKFSCDEEGIVIFTIVQDNTAGNPIQQTAVLNCIEEIHDPTQMVVVLNPEEVTSCPAKVLISVQVQDVFDDPLPDGTIVQFAAEYGQFVPGPSAQMFGGWARVTLELDAATPPITRVLATTQGLSPERIDILANCSAPGNAPTDITFALSSASVECGKSAFLGGKVVDEDGANVADGTPVKLIASNGTVEPAEATTSGGGFTVTYKAPATAGDDTITAAVGEVFKTTTVTVTCGTGGTSTGTSTAGGATGTTTGGTAGTGGTGGATGGTGTGGGATGANGTGTIRPPSTGDAGLRARGTAPAGLALLLSLAGASVLVRRRAA